MVPGASEAFHEAWSRDIYPAIADDYNSRVLEKPSRVAAAAEKKKEKKAKKKEKKSDDDDASDHQPGAIDRKMTDILAEVAAKKERRNAYLNLAWTGPVDNTSLQTSIPYEKVANMALDMFIDLQSAPAAAASAAADGGDAGSSDEEAAGQPKRTALELHLPTGKKLKWKIPTLVEKGFEIPIYLTDTTAPPPSSAPSSGSGWTSSSTPCGWPTTGPRRRRT